MEILLVPSYRWQTFTFWHTQKVTRIDFNNNAELLDESAQSRQDSSTLFQFQSTQLEERLVQPYIFCNVAQITTEQIFKYV